MKPLEFTYRNHRGEIEDRRIIPDAIEYMANPGFNYQPGWFISGECLDRKARRSFRLSHIVFNPDHLGNLRLLLND